LVELEVLKYLPSFPYWVNGFIYYIYINSFQYLLLYWVINSLNTRGII